MIVSHDMVLGLPHCVDKQTSIIKTTTNDAKFVASRLVSRNKA